MVTKKIKALKDFELKTYAGNYSLVKGEVKIVQFKNQIMFKALLKYDNFIEADKNEEETRPLPNVLPAVTEDTIVLVDNTFSKEVVEESAKEEVVSIDGGEPGFPPIELIQDCDESTTEPNSELGLDKDEERN